MEPKEAAIFLAIVVAGVYIAGWTMNRFRDVDVVNDAIRGFDH